MRVLLDTNVLLWTLAGSPRALPARDLILDSTTDVFVSALSWWEIAIKVGTGKLAIDLPRARKKADESGFLELPLKGSYAEVLLTLPVLHRDPFDRMLIAQAIAEPMRLITGDAQLAAYSELVYLI